MTATARRLEYIPLDELTPAERNPKRHDQQVIARGIDRFGLVDIPVLDERTGRLVAGHGRRDDLLARRAAGQSPPDGITTDESGRWLVPTVVGWRSSSDAEAHAAGVTLNQATVAGGFDEAELAVLIGEIGDVDEALVGVLGFDDAELASLLAQIEAPAPAPTNDLDAPPETAPALTSYGDVWRLGPHRIMCGDARDADDVRRLLDGATINLAFTSPPYAEQRTYDEASGFTPIPPEDYVEWFAPVAGNVAEHLADDGSWFVNIKPASRGLDVETYVLDLVLAHARRWGWHWVTEFCWDRPGIPQQPNGRFKNAFEPVYQFARGKWKHRPEAVMVASPKAFGYLGTDSRQAAEHQGRGMTWDDSRKGEGLAYPSNRLPTFSGSHEATGHGAAFPVGLPRWFLRAYTDPGDVAYDPFVGSGSTVLAAHAEGRIGYGMEISPAYCDLIARRFERATGITPIAELSGEPVSFER